MKKLYYILTLTFVTLLAACSQEEMVNKETEDNQVCISAELPADIAATRAQIAVPADYKLRCIIEVWTKSTSPTLKYRQEVAVAGGELPTFDFGLRPGDYSCLMWADFIKKNAVTSEVTSEDVTYTHFEDTCCQYQGRCNRPLIRYRSLRWFLCNFGYQEECYSSSTNNEDEASVCQTDSERK